MESVNEVDDDIAAPTKQKPKTIQAIKKNDVHQICSGQVVLNLAIAVKELVENSLDAGATSIEVRLKEYGSKLIEVVDNGSGVEEANFQGLTLKHHTSKLQEFSDLISVATFGFRGEALSSLCALSELTVTTRHVDASCGSRLVYDFRGKLVSQSPCARQVGTTVSIGNLFGSLPVRQKEFHRNLRREFAKMTQLLYAYCLVATNVKITCTNQTLKGSRTTVAATHGCKTVRENIASVFGSKQVQSLLDLKQVDVSSSESSQQSDGRENVLSSSQSFGAKESDPIRVIESSTSQFRIDGYISSCEHSQGRGASDRQFFYVNSRPCEPVKIMKLVNEVYHSFNGHQQPFVFLNVLMERSDVDVNVTPDKRQVFLDNEKELIAIIRASLMNLFEGIPSTFRFQNVPIAPRSSSPDPPPTQENRLATLLTRWKNPLAESRSFKRPPEEDVDEGAQPKQPCIMKFFQRKAAIETPAISEDTWLPHVANEDVAQQDITLISNDNNLAKEDYTNETKQCIKNCVQSVDDSEEKTPDDKSPATDATSEVTCESDKFSVELLSSGTTMSDPTNDIRTKIFPRSPLCVESDPVVEPNLRANDHMEVYSKSLCKEITVNESDKELPAEFEARTRRRVHLDVSFEDIANNLAKRCRVRKTVGETVVRFRSSIDPTKNKTAEQELSREISKDKFREMEIIGQFNLGFIVTRLGSDLFIIDQHASDEKYNFETLQLTEALTHQRLVCPVSLDLSAVGESVLLDNLPVFKSNGFDFSVDADAETTNRVKMTAIPVGRNCDFGKEDVNELLFMLQDAPGTMCRPSRVRAMFASRACRKSVMIGSALSKSDMRRLVENMGKIEQPWVSAMPEVSNLLLPGCQNVTRLRDPNHFEMPRKMSQLLKIWQPFFSVSPEFGWVNLMLNEQLLPALLGISLGLV